MGWTDYLKHAIPGYTAYKAGEYAVKKLTEEPESAQQKRADLNETGLASNQFAEYGQGQFMGMSAEAAAARDYLGRLARGENSVSAEQLRQGNQQALAAQRSMAASAAPQNAAMAARNAAMNMGRIQMGLAGQQAVAGLAERQAAQKALMDSILQQRQQDAQVALGSRQNAVNAYGGVTPEASTMEKLMPVINAGVGGAGAAAKFSDERLKEDIEDGDSEANKAMRGLRAFTYKYKDKSLSTTGGKSELGIMAQDLEKAGLKHTVFETPKGKAVHGAALATANTAMLAALERRVSRIEGGKKKG